MAENRNENGASKAKRDPALARQTLNLALAAWDLARRRQGGTDNARGHFVNLRARQRLVASFERERGIPQADRSMFLLRPEARGSCLLVHGISTGPGALTELGERLHDSGWNVYIMRLPGYGLDDSTLSDNSWESYLNQVIQGYRLLSGGPGKVHVVGLGYGATLALLLSRAEKPASLTLLAPALIARESLFQRLLIRLRLNRLGFVRRWLGWSAGLVEGMDRARGCAGQAKMPIFAAQCEDDESASPNSLRFLQRKARHKASLFKLFPEGGHSILTSHGDGSLYEGIVEFINSDM